MLGGRGSGSDQLSGGLPGGALKKATSGWSINTTLLAISPLSLKHLARQRSPWHGALVSQQLQSFVVCFALLGQSGMSAIWAEFECVAAAAIAALIGASVTASAISNASRKRCTTKATSGRTIPTTGGAGQAVRSRCGFNSTFLIANP